MKYDIIGDIHGYVVPLIDLLKKLGYYRKNGYYQHAEGRKVIFLGDFVDRGPHIRETLQLVKAMMDNGTAEAVMGNHEYNAICYHHAKPDGSGYLRPHTEKNTEQHTKTLIQFSDYRSEWNTWIDWFNRLPLFIEKENLRAVHACWDQSLISHIRSISSENRLSLETIHSSQKKGTANYEAIERTLKGKETILPDGLTFQDKGNHERREVRTKWWMNPEGMEYNEYFMNTCKELKGKRIAPGEFADQFYSEEEMPVFFGHYWLEGEPALQRDNVACLDYSIAKGGKLVAYCWNGEKKLDGNSIKY